MSRRGRAAAVLMVAAAAAAVPFATAEQTRSQQFFRDQLLADREVSAPIKELLRTGGFVESRIAFDDLTGDGKDDAVVRVNTGGAQGVVAFYVFSTDTPGKSDELVPVFRSQKLTRASTRVSSDGIVYYRYSRYAPGDELCCPSSITRATLGWDSERKRFTVVAREKVAPPKPAGG